MFDGREVMGKQLQHLMIDRTRGFTCHVHLVLGMTSRQ